MKDFEICKDCKEKEKYSQQFNEDSKKNDLPLGSVAYVYDSMGDRK